MPIQTYVPSELFGPMMVAIEYMECFKTLFDMDDDFPDGILLGMCCLN